MAERSPTLGTANRAWTLGVAALCLLPLLLQLPAPTALAIGSTALLIGTLSWKRPLSNIVRAVLAVSIMAAVLAQFGLRLGRDTGCALLGAMIAIKPSETVNLRDARSLVGFALFAPFSTFLLDQGPTTLALGLVATFAALGTLARLATAETGGRPVQILHTLQQTARLVLLGLPVAMAVFWLFPRIPSPLWGIPDRAQARPGLSDEMSPGDWVDLLADDSVAARARFIGRTPAQQSMYWRGPVLWDFDGRTWRRGGDERAWQPTAVPSRIRWTYDLEIEATDRRQLVALDLPMAAPPQAHVRADYSLEAPRPLAQATRWRMTSALPTRFEATLSAGTRLRALRLPPRFNPRTLAHGRELRRRLQRDEAVVRHALGWIRRDFGYSISAPPLGRDTADEFLFGTRLGYCEHFAGGFTILMRAAGIPARVVTGYAGGRYNQLGGYWMIRRMDAHAWTEVWLQGRGWVRVDPTAAVAPENIYDTLEDRLTSGSGVFDVLGSPGGLFQAGDWMRRNWNDLVLGFDASRQSRLLRPLGVRRTSPAVLAAIFGAVAALTLLVMVLVSLRGPRERDPVLRGWRVVGRRYARLGLGREQHEPATTWAERISKQRPQNAQELLDLTARFTRWRYADSNEDTESTRRLARDLRAHRPT